MPSFKGQEDEKDSAKETKMERSWRQEERKESSESTKKAFQGERCDPSLFPADLLPADLPTRSLPSLLGCDAA